MIQLALYQYYGELFFIRKQKNIVNQALIRRYQICYTLQKTTHNRLYVVHRIKSAASPESWTDCRSTARCAMRMAISTTSSREISLSSDSANRISPTCRTSLPSGLPSNFGSRNCSCARVTKSLPRRCRTSRRRAGCHTDSTIENCPTAW